MTGIKYFWPVGTAVLFWLALALLWRDRQPALNPARIVSDGRQTAHDYERMTARLFDIRLDGTLRLSYRLNDDPELRALGFQCVLRHGIETTPGGTACSQWELPFTESYLVPRGAADLQWRQPNGKTIVFRNGRTTRAPMVFGEQGCGLQKLGPSAYYVYNSGGDRFLYDHGCLSEITTRSGHPYQVATRGGLILKVAEMGLPDSERTLFAAEFDDLGHCTRVEFAGGLTDAFGWDAQGLLKNWKESSGRQVGFQYNDGLLARVTGPGNEDLPITWSENKVFVNHEATLGAPVYLKSAGPRNYTLSYSSRGLFIETKGPDQAQNSTTLVNPWSPPVLIQKSGGETLRFYYFPGEDEETR